MTNNDVIDGVGDTMVEIRSASTTPSCRGRLRLSQQVYIVLLIATLLLIILSTSIFGNIVQPSSVSDNHVHIRAIDNLRKTDAPSIGIDMEQPSIHERDTIEYKTYPGFIGEVSVKCGGHEARTCDECPQGNGASWCHGQCEWIDEKCVRSSQLEHLHPDYFRITARYAFQPVMNNNHVFVNVIMVRSPFRNRDDEDVYKFYRDEILFLGISSFESFPLKSPNPYSAKYESEYYLNMFPGFLHMMRDPNVYFPDSTKTILMSQSDFMLDEPQFFRQEHANDAKIYDFVYSGGVSRDQLFYFAQIIMHIITNSILFDQFQDQDVETDCVGWASYNKNFSFVREALEVMCSSEFNVTGVLVANKNKADTMACTIPAACDGKIVQTTFLDQDEFFDYLVKVCCHVF